MKLLPFHFFFFLSYTREEPTFFFSPFFLFSLFIVRFFSSRRNQSRLQQRYEKAIKVTVRKPEHLYRGSRPLEQLLECLQQFLMFLRKDKRR